MRRKPVMIESVTLGPWCPAVNWVMHGERLLANMTQYRVTARNCEAKRLHIVALTEPNVACEYAHVGAARQHEETVASSLDGTSLLGRPASCPYKLGCPSCTMANCGFPHS